MVTLAAAAAAMPACGGEGPAQPQPGADPIRAISSRLLELAESGEFSGVVVIRRHGDVMLERAYGLADRVAGRPNRVDTQFNLASMGKMFTGVAVVQLAERGKLDLDARVGAYLPWLPRAIGRRVTIEHLLTHTSGLHSFFEDPRYQRLKTGLTTLAAYRPVVVADRPEFRPGRRFLYSNTGYVLLGMVIEKVTGRDYYDYVQEHVFDAAGMTDTGFYAAKDTSPARAVGYTRRGSRLHENTPTLPPRGSPAGGVYSTARDMIAFADALWEHRLLSARFTRLATTSRVDDPEGGYGYGFGIRRGRDRQPSSVGHNGGAPGIATEFTMNRGLGYTVVVLANLDPPAVTQAIDLVLDELRIP